MAEEIKAVDDHIGNLENLLTRPSEAVSNNPQDTEANDVLLRHVCERPPSHVAQVSVYTPEGVTIGSSDSANGQFQRRASERAATLRNEGCEEVQGYLYAKPLPAADFDADFEMYVQGRRLARADEAGCGGGIPANTQKSTSRRKLRPA